MYNKLRKPGRFSMLSILLFLFGTLAVGMGGCEMSCNSNDASDDVRDVVDEIGDEAEDIAEEIKDKN